MKKTGIELELLEDSAVNKTWCLLSMECYSKEQDSQRSYVLRSSFLQNQGVQKGQVAMRIILSRFCLKS